MDSGRKVLYKGILTSATCTPFRLIRRAKHCTWLLKLAELMGISEERRSGQLIRNIASEPLPPLKLALALGDETRLHVDESSTRQLSRLSCATSQR